MSEGESSPPIKILVLNGPNLNLLGTREPDTYGHKTFKDLVNDLHSWAKALDVTVSVEQSNHEGHIIDAIHGASEQHSGIVINAGAYTHTSVAIRDAIAAVGLPTVEVHISNVYKRETFRHHSYLAPVVLGQISGFGFDSYHLGLRALVNYLRTLN